MTEISKARAYVEQKAWDAKESGNDQLAVRSCPFCGNDNYKFYINVSGGARDGLWNCFVCDEKGSLYQLRTRLGDQIDGVMSLQEAALRGQAAPPLPDVASAKYRLLNDPAYGEVLDYLVVERGLSLDVIEKMGLGAEKAFEKTWVVIPYHNKQGNLVYVKYRTAPPHKKEFRSSQGREVPLYNEGVITEGMDELIFVEGEMDCLSCLSHGIANVVGVPGANVKKAAWITKVDAAAPKKLYVLYDNDKVGQQAARDMAVRLGIEKVHNIVLPEFQTKDGKPGKDINEWFQAGYTIEDFNTLKEKSRPFDVAGVQSLPHVIEEIIEDMDERGSRRWDVDSPWPKLNEKLGGACFGEVIGIIAEGKIGKTTKVMNWLDYLAEKYGLSSLNLCLEMPQKNLVRKWISYKTQTDDKELTKENVLEALEKAKTMPGELLFGFTRVGKVDEVFDLIRQAVRRYGVKAVAFDNLQFLVRSIDHSAQETSIISKKFKELAMELNILILLIVQPNRVREGEIVGARNAHGSSAIEKDVDAMIALHRNRVMEMKADEFTGFAETQETFEPHMLVKVDLTRYAAGGICTLFMDGAKSTVRELTESDCRPAEKPKAGLTLEVESPTSALAEV